MSMKNKCRYSMRLAFRGLFLLGILSLILRPVPALGQGKDLLERAKKEGEVVLYSTMPVSAFRVFEKAAKLKYPFLDIHHIQLSSSRQVSKVMFEHGAGKVQADIVGNSQTAMLYYKQKGVVGRYDSPETKYLIKGSADPDGYWVGITTDLLITAFNTKFFSRKDAPKGFEDFLNPKFKGQMGINRSAAYGLIGMMALRGDKQGIGYLKELSRQDLRPAEGFTHMTNLLAAGEYPIAIFAQVSKVEALQKKGAPVDWLPTSPTFATLSAVGVTRDAAHPAAARLLLDFYISPEGQQALSGAGKIPLRKGIKSPSKDIDELLGSENLLVIKVEQEYKRYMKLYSEILGIQ